MIWVMITTIIRMLERAKGSFRLGWSTATERAWGTISYLLKRVCGGRHLYFDTFQALLGRLIMPSILANQISLFIESALPAALTFLSRDSLVF